MAMSLADYGKKFIKTTFLDEKYGVFWHSLKVNSRICANMNVS